MAETVNKGATERAQKWQNMDSIPEDHSMSVMKIGKRILKDKLKTPINLPPTPENTETKDLVKQVNELRKEEERLKTDFPEATKAMEPERLGSSTSSGEILESRSQSSGILVEPDDCTSTTREQTPDLEAGTDQVASEASGEENETSKTA